MAVSSANNRIFDLVLSVRSLIYIKTVLGLGPNPERPLMPQVLFQTFHFPEQQFVFSQRGMPVSISSWGLWFRMDAVLAGVSDDWPCQMLWRSPARQGLFGCPLKNSSWDLQLASQVGSHTNACFWNRAVSRTVGCDGPCEKPHLLWLCALALCTGC